MRMSEDWRRSLDNREAVVAVAIDLSKAFDSIDHIFIGLAADVLLPERSQTES